MEKNDVQIIRQQREMAREMKFPATIQLELLEKERAVGTARVGCGYYRYDPMLSIECPKGFCEYKLRVHHQSFAGCDFMDNPATCPYSGLEIPGIPQKRQLRWSPIIETTIEAVKGIKGIIWWRKKKS